MSSSNHPVSLTADQLAIVQEEAYQLGRNSVFNAVTAAGYNDTKLRRIKDHVDTKTAKTALKLARGEYDIEGDKRLRVLPALPVYGQQCKIAVETMIDKLGEFVKTVGEWQNDPLTEEQVMLFKVTFHADLLVGGYLLPRDSRLYQYANKTLTFNLQHAVMCYASHLIETDYPNGAE